MRSLVSLIGSFNEKIPPVILHNNGYATLNHFVLLKIQEKFLFNDVLECSLAVGIEKGPAIAGNVFPRMFGFDSIIFHPLQMARNQTSSGGILACCARTAGMITDRLGLGTISVLS